MKRRFSFLLTAIFLLSVGLCAVTGLSSCENFFSGADLKREVENAVAYANAQSCKLYLKSDSASGSFLSEGGKECKVGFTTDIQFTLNQNEYFFVSLEAVSTTDENQSREDCVEFAINQKETDSYRGVYVVTVKVLKYASDILIRPKCMEIPCILSHSPASKSPQFANTPVVINFNIPMEDREATAEKSLFNFENISVSYAGEDMSSYFDEPEFNADKTVLTIRPIGAKIKKFIEDNYLNYLDIDFSFSDTIVATNGDVSFPLKQDSNSNFSVRYNSSVEETPPLRGDFFVTRYDVTLDSAPDLDEKYILPQIVCDVYDYYMLDYVSILMPSTFYIYGKFYDKDSGVQSIEVSEILKDQVGYGDTDRKETVTVYDWKSADVKFKRDDNGWNSFVLKYTMQESLKEKPGSGVFELAITVKDACDNAAEKEIFYVNYEEYNSLEKTRMFSKSSNYYTWHSPYVFNTPFSKCTDNPNRYDFDKYYSDIKTIRINEYKPMYFLIGKRDGFEEDLIPKNYITSDNVKYYCEYTDKNGMKRKEPFSNFDLNVMEWSLVLDIDEVSDVSFTLLVEYDGICIGQKVFTFPPESTLSYSTYRPNTIYIGSNSLLKFTGILMYADGTYNIVYPNYDIPLSAIPEGCKLYMGLHAIEEGAYLIEDDYYDYEFNQSTGKYERVSKNWPDYEYTFENGLGTPTTKHYKSGLLGALIGPFQRSHEFSQTPKPSYTYEISQSKKGYLDINLQFDLDVWTKYDSIFLDFWHNQTSTRTILTENDTSVSGEKVCFTFSLEESLFYRKGKFITGNSFSLTGIKDYMQSETLTKSIGQTEILDFDSISPTYYKSEYDIENKYLIMYFYDDGSGLKDSMNIWLNGTKSTQDFFPAENDMSVIYLSFSLDGERLIEYEVSDKAGNITTGSFNYYVTRWYNAGYYEEDNESATALTSGFISRLYYDNAIITVYKFDETNRRWTTVKKLTKNDVERNGDVFTLKSGSTVTFDSGKFYRIYTTVSRESSYSHDDAIICATNSPGNKNYNYIFANGTSEKSVVISSGYNKVFVRLCATKQPLEVCKNWDLDTWEHVAICVNEEVVSVTAEKPQVYDFSDVSIGYDRHYCVIAHFADGSRVASQIFGK